MGRVTTTAAVLGAGALVVRRVRAARHAGGRPDERTGGRPDGDRAHPHQDGTRWQPVTVLGDPDDVAPGGRLPAPLARLGTRVETRVRPAPGGRGTEIAARLRGPAPTGVLGAAARLRGTDPRQRLRSALREAKQLVEVGEVLVVDPAPHGRRGLVGTALVGTATRLAGREGVL